MKIDWDSLWREFEKEAQYLTLDGKVQLKTIAINFAKFIRKLNIKGEKE